ncbi:MAG TPA: ABC transporter ATP-binding protein [Armatimonadota bacterium]|jgi:subfamily B ATP-binding cassette protein MsbA
MASSPATRRPLISPVIGRLWAFLHPHRAPLFAGLAFTGVVSLLNLVTLALLKGVADTIGGHSKLTLSQLGVLIVAAFSARAVMSFGQSFFVSDAMQKMTRDIRTAVYAHVQSLPLKFFEDRRTGQLMSSITSDVPVMTETFQSGAIDSITAPIMVIGTVSYMVHLSLRLTLAVILVVPLMLLVIQFAAKRMRTASWQMQQRALEISDILQETFAGVRVIKSFTAEETETRRFTERSQDAFRSSMRAVRVRAILGPCIELIATGGFVAVLVLSVGMVKREELTTGGLAAFLLALNMLGQNAKSLGNIQLTLRRLTASAERVFALLDTKSDLVEKPDAVTLERAEGDVEFRDVSFAYGDGPEVLHHVSFRAARGDVVALVGESGSGKSTIVNLVPRFYDVTAGSVYVDGRDVREYTIHSLRLQVAMVPQDTLLFSGTIRDNILYGRPGASETEMRAAAVAAHADMFVQALPDGYETLVGERGAKLSGGQKQRVAIARALLKDPRILILDEATSALDTESESLVQDALNRLMQGRTTLVIAHRLSTIRNADRIIVLRAGEIVEEGSHDSLLARGGVYAKLYEMQFRERPEA